MPYLVPRNQSRRSRSLLSSSRQRKKRCCAFASVEYKPCFQFARRDRARPFRVRGPVLAPPCIRQRPLCMAGALHGVPLRVLAPHRGAVLGSPVGLPFLSHPLPCTEGSLLVISFLSSLPASLLWALSLVNGTHYGLAATVYVYMFDGKVLLPFAAMFFQCFHLRRECPQ
jgi:hypothetical protein